MVLIPAGTVGVDLLRLCGCGLGLKVTHTLSTVWQSRRWAEVRGEHNDRRLTLVCGSEHGEALVWHLCVCSCCGAVMPLSREAQHTVYCSAMARTGPVWIDGPTLVLAQSGPRMPSLPLRTVACCYAKQQGQLQAVDGQQPQLHVAAAVGRKLLAWRCQSASHQPPPGVGWRCGFCQQTTAVLDVAVSSVCTGCNQTGGWQWQRMAGQLEHEANVVATLDWHTAAQRPALAVGTSLDLQLWQLGKSPRLHREDARPETLADTSESGLDDLLSKLDAMTTQGLSEEGEAAASSCEGAETEVLSRRAVFPTHSRVGAARFRRADDDGVLPAEAADTARELSSLLGPLFG